ncbi:hypothetical protein DXG01_007739 [Tephrocybe rancida]|nr:hypothetical protein DXG01_007739 [Tephrocybe rancida]
MEVNGGRDSLGPNRSGSWALWLVQVKEQGFYIFILFERDSVGLWQFYGERRAAQMTNVVTEASKSLSKFLQIDH